MTSIAVIGAGNWGQNHIRELHSLGVLKVIVESDEERAKRLEADYPNIEVMKSLDSLPDKNLDGAVVATPVPTHHQIAKFCLESGIHVLVEKPLAATFAEGQELVDMAEAANLTLLAGHLLEYHPAVRKIEEILRGGAIGSLRYLSSHRLNYGRIRKDEDVLLSFAPHDIGLVAKFAGGRPLKSEIFETFVTSKTRADIALMTLVFEGGIQSHIYVSWLHPHKEHKLHLVGETGIICFDGASSSLRLFQGVVTNGNLEGQSLLSGLRVEQEWEFADANPLRAELLDFLDSVEKGTQPRVNPRDALLTLQIISMCSHT